MITAFNNINLSELKNQRPHFPVLIREILENIIPSEDFVETTSVKTVLDCTFGAGGYSELILKYSNYNVIAIDRDITAKAHFDRIKTIYPQRINFYLEKFSNFDAVLKESQVEQVDAIVMDLGFSSMQINNFERGFSLRGEGFLSMEMGLNNFNAFEFLNNAKAETIADVIYYYGEERKARQITNSIVNYRQKAKITTTKDLYNIIIKVVGRGNNKSKINPATKTFQAIRIYVNDELNELTKALSKTINSLKLGGKILVVSFHSLEDRIVKDFFNNKPINNYKDNLLNINNNSDSLKSLTKKPILPKADEVEVNPPSSSAKLRIAQRI